MTRLKSWTISPVRIFQHKPLKKKNESHRIARQAERRSDFLVHDADRDAGWISHQLACELVAAARRNQRENVTIERATDLTYRAVGAVQCSMLGGMMA
jgi:hypothetical protein